MSIKKYILFAAILSSCTLIIASCGGNKKLAGETEKGSQVPIPEIKLEDYYKQTLSYKSFSGKANMHIKNPKLDQKVVANIKMNHKKNIWSSVQAMGGLVEAARAYITPDSLKALVPLTRDAYALSFKEGLELIQADLEFVSLQNLFMGNPLLADKKNPKVKLLDSNTVQVVVLQDDYTLTILYDKTTQLIKEQFITNNIKKFTCKILQSNYKPLVDKQPFAFTRSISINNNGETTELDMNFSKAEIDIPASVSFRIPDSYSLKSIK